MNASRPAAPVAPAAPAVNAAQTVRVAELFLSLQGEGPSAGRPAHFLRLQGCDVGCHWCDTKYSWEPAAGRTISFAEAETALRALGEAPLLVVTGGEPLQHPGVAELLARAVERWPQVEVETSGVQPPPLSRPNLHYNVSPKLPSATPRWQETWRHAAAFVAEPNAIFKIVVGDPPDPEDALRLIAERGLPRPRVMLMPEGLTDQAVRAHAVALAELCKRHGLGLSPRLHVWMWGARRGV
jgi:organic radical activating enzyme